MAKLALAGNNDPFIVQAASLYKAANSAIEAIEILPSIKSVFRAIGDNGICGLVPIENMVEGHVFSVLELLLQSNLTIIDEIIVPSTYACISHNSERSEWRTVYTTHQALPECSEFLGSFTSIDLQHVESLDLLDELLGNNPNAAALIPSFAVENRSYPYLDPNVSDYAGNSTRYIVVAEQEHHFEPDKTYKTSFVLLETTDKPGVLSDILTAFSSRSINLTSIISRPTREHFGTYHFFIDCRGFVLSPELQAALSQVKKWGHVKLLGSFPAGEAEVAQAEAPLPDFIPSMLENPLRPPERKPRITIAAGHGPYRNTLDALATFNLSAVRGKRVLLKPNIGRVAEAYSGVVTNPQVVAAAIDAFRAAGADVAVGESPITGVDMNAAFEKSGIAFIAHERNCPLIDMDRRLPVDVAVRDGAIIDHLKICADIFDFDFIVSMPVMKTHMHTVVTLSVKNMKGCLWRRSKVELHMLPRLPFSEDKSLNIAIADMASVLKPHLVIIDGTVGMEGLGPSSGETKPLDLVIIGNNAFAADAVACTIMGIAPEKVPHLRIAAERGYGSLEPDSYHVTNPDWHSLCQPFAPVPSSLTMNFPRVTILDEQSCSACQSTVMLFMKRYGDKLSEYFPENRQVSFAIGKGQKGIPSNTICIGNCTRRFRDTGVYVPGCPPVASSILAELDKLKQKSAPDHASKPLRT